MLSTHDNSHLVRNNKKQQQPTFDSCAFLPPPTTRRRKFQSPPHPKSSFSLLYSSVQQDQQPLGLRHSKAKAKAKRKRKKKQPKPPFTTISNELGCSPAFHYQPFDPFNLSSSSSTDDDKNFVFYREAELKHGRVAMLATLGMIVPDLMVQYVNLDDIVVHVTPSGTLVGGGVVVGGGAWPEPMGGIKALQTIPWQIWVVMLAIIGIVEVVVLVPPSPLSPSSLLEENEEDEREEGKEQPPLLRIHQTRKKRKQMMMVEGEGMPGDYGWGYFGIRDKRLHERSLLSELENGRLAMIAFVIQVLLEVASGQSIVEQWMDWYLKNG